MRFILNIDPSKEEEITATVHSRSDLTDNIETLVMKHTGSDRITAYTEDDITALLFSDIECITVIGGKTYAIDGSAKQYRIKSRLYEIESILPSCFIRINKSSLANEKKLVKLKASFTGAVDAVFKCGYTEYVSRRCFAKIKRRFTSK